MNEEFETWKQNVSRSTVFLQANASLQVQVVGFFFSAILFAVCVGRIENQGIIFVILIPLASFIFLTIGSSYFNYLKYQSSFIQDFGVKFDEKKKIRTHEQLWNTLRARNIFYSIFRFLTAFKEVPYYPIMMSYIVAPQLLFWLWHSRASAHALPMYPIEGFSFNMLLLCASIFFILQVIVAGMITRRVWDI